MACQNFTTLNHLSFPWKIMDIFRRIFGFPDTPERSANYDDNAPIEPPRFPGRNFNIFSDPLEIHRYFEQQIDQFFQGFGMAPPGEGFGQINDHDDSIPPITSREHFLKPDQHQRVDEDLDGKLTIGDLDTFFNKSQMVPKQQFELFSKSVQVSTVRNPDGTYETQRTVTDSEGNTETTITRKLGDKEYTITKKVDKDGKEELQENLINILDEDKNLFTKRPNSSIFDILFK